MKKVNVHEAKTKLSQLINLAAQGEKIIICKAGYPVAQLVAISIATKKRCPGDWAGKVKIQKDFDIMPYKNLRLLIT